MRSAIKEWQYTLINVLGLAIGIATFVFIVQYLELENNIDNFHSDKDRIYKIYADLKWNAAEAQFPNTPPALGTALLADIPDIEEVTRLRQYYHTSVEIDNQIFLETNVRAVDSTFLKVFDFKILEGNAKTLFTNPDEVVLARDYAIKYFGDSPALGQSILINDRLKMVSAVIENPRKDSHFNYSILLSLNADQGVAYFEWSWLWSNVDTYIKLNKGVSIAQVENKFEQLVLNNAGPSIERITGSSLDDFFTAGNQLKYYAVPLKEVYYDPQNDLGPSGNRTYMKIFGVVALVIILLASINYINLATARAMRRVQEVGIRKVVGSNRWHIMLQFILEGALITFIAGVIAALVMSLLNQPLQMAFDIRWNLDPFTSINSFQLLISTILGTTILSSIYPAIYISSFQPSDTLKSHSSNKSEGRGFRKILVVVQFITSFTIIIFAFAANEQLEYLKNRNLGFNREQLLVVDHADFLETQETFKNKVLQQSFVVNATYTSHVPGKGGNFEVFKKIGEWDQDYMAYLLDADSDFFDTYGIDLIEGNSFTAKDMASNQKKVIVNQLAVKDFELDQPIGSKIMALDRGGELTISGVMNDVNFFMSNREPAETVIRPFDDSLSVFPLSYLTIKLNTAGLQGSIEQLSAIWDEQNSGIDFHYSFFDEIFNDNFKKENQMGALLQLFSGLTIFIAILGLLGLISYSAQQSKKMIGIRKVFGAGVGSIIKLITWDFLKLILIAFVIAIPVANYFIEDWLTQFVFRMELSVYHFVVPGSVIIFFSLLMTGIQSYKASAANPIDSIHDE